MKIAILLLFVSTFVFGQSVPTTLPVDQTTVYNVVHSHAISTANNLLSINANAVSTYFDPTYSSYPAGSLLRYRGYTVITEPDALIFTGRYVTPLSATEATITGYLENIDDITVLSYGVCYSTSIMPTIANSIVAGSSITTISGIGYYSSTITSGLVQFTKYYARAYVTTPKGTFYGDVVIHSENHVIHTHLYDYVTFMPEPAIEQLAQGGVVAYIEHTSEENVAHGIIAATTEYNDVIWGCGDRMYSTGLYYKDGAANTAAIDLRCSDTMAAYYACIMFTGGGYTDWVLPSLEDLSLMMNSLTGSYALLRGNVAYWSSVESATALGVWSLAHYFNLPSGGGVTSKANAARVRPCRYF